MRTRTKEARAEVPELVVGDGIHGRGRERHKDNERGHGVAPSKGRDQANTEVVERDQNLLLHLTIF